MPSIASRVVSKRDAIGQAGRGVSEGAGVGQDSAEPARKERKVHYGDEILTIDLEDVFDQ